GFAYLLLTTQMQHTPRPKPIHTHGLGYLFEATTQICVFACYKRLQLIEHEAVDLACQSPKFRGSMKLHAIQGVMT
ncbi:MAG: hypothetical protein K5905_26085, partial [Roseibium sp.]|uniref:hypothetical protein n=1 Tax=Roseibium sp. TaxID=1936156 RepID=UPI0026110522